MTIFFLHLLEEFMKWLAVELSKAFVGSDKIIEKLKEE